MAWWAAHYGAGSPKRHKGFTNNRECGRFNLGKLHLKQFQKSQDPKAKTTIQYIDGSGKKRYKGSSALKASQTLSSTVHEEGTSLPFQTGLRVLVGCSPDIFSTSWQDPPTPTKWVWRWLGRVLASRPHPYPRAVTAQDLHAKIRRTCSFADACPEAERRGLPNGNEKTFEWP